MTGDINPGYLRTGRQLQAFVDDDFTRWNTDWRSTYINVAQSIYTASSRDPQGIGALRCRVTSVTRHPGPVAVQAAAG